MDTTSACGNRGRHVQTDEDWSHDGVFIDRE